MKKRARIEITDGGRKCGGRTDGGGKRCQDACGQSIPEEKVCFGVVRGDIKIKDDKAIYSVETDSGTCIVVTSGRQAVLDAVFLRDGTILKIDSDVYGDVICPERLMIDINSEANTDEDQ